MKRVLLCLLLGACGSTPTSSLSLGLTTSQLALSDLGSVLIVVLRGPKGCETINKLMSPLDDPELEVVAHALYPIDAESKQLKVPANQPLSVYVEAFTGPSGQRPAVGRGCSDVQGDGDETRITVELSEAAETK